MRRSPFIELARGWVVHSDKYESWMSEWNLAQVVKMDRIWDCGKLSYEFIN